MRAVTHVFARRIINHAISSQHLPNRRFPAVAELAKAASLGHLDILTAAAPIHYRVVI